MDIPLGSATAAVVGATGAIGQVCADLLADDVERLYLIGRRQDKLEELRDRLGAVSSVHSESRVDRQHKMDVLAERAVDIDSDQRHA
jgi:NADP-dependent 3-hydroxy acid dehydrogenase YdfG